MLLFQFYIILIALCTAITCSLPGVFLVLQGNALISDAISHSILLGIVLSFLYTKNLHSPLLFIGAVCTSICTVLLTQWLKKLKFVHEDAAIGLLFPFFFACAVLIINIYSSDVHLDTDAVLLGELALTPFENFYLFSYNVGPIHLWLMAFLASITTLCILIFKKELTAYSFDPEYISTIIRYPQLIYYGLMLLTSISIIGAFQAAGTILVVSFIIVPTACARLLCNSINQILLVSILLSTITVLAGYLCASYCNASIAGSIASLNGLLFCIIFMLNKFILTQK